MALPSRKLSFLMLTSNIPVRGVMHCLSRWNDFLYPHILFFGGQCQSMSFSEPTLPQAACHTSSINRAVAIQRRTLVRSTLRLIRLVLKCSCPNLMQGKAFRKNSRLLNIIATPICIWYKATTALRFSSKPPVSSTLRLHEVLQRAPHHVRVLPIRICHPSVVSKSISFLIAPR